MTVEQIRDFLERFKAKISHIRPEQTAEQIARMLKYWHPPHDFIVDDQNLLQLFDFCLFSHGYISPMWLDTTCREHRDYLRWHQAPTPAPAPEPEPAPAQPKLEGRDSLGEAVSTEKPISTVQSAPKESTALQDGADYAWNCRNKNNELARARQECRNDATRTVGGVTYVDHALEQQLYEKREADIEKKYAPKPVQNIDAQVDALVAKMKRAATKPRYRRY